jgi:hypothetical protein
MKKNRLLALTALALSLAFIGAYATPARSQLVFIPQGPTGTMSEIIGHPDCPNKLHMTISANYPIKTGNTQVDAFFRKQAADFMAEKKKSGWLLYADTCKSLSDAFAYYDYLAYKPNPETLGILRGIIYHEGGAHANNDNTTYNFDLRTGREIEIKDFFIDPRLGINGIYKFAYADLCNNSETHIAAHFVLGGKCGVDKNTPRKLLELSGSLNGLGHLVLTERGANLNFGAYEIWSYGQGDYILSIPKNTLIKFGARDFWGLSAPKF